jgi:hypothetical protein
MFNANFHRLLEITPDGDAPVCPEEACAKPEVPTVSEWAKEHLKFEADKIQQSVLDHDAHRLILCCARQWGKTTIVAIKALHTAIFNPGTEIVVISQSLKQASILLNKVCQSAAILGFPRKRVLGHENSLHLPNGSKIFGVANSEKSSRGYTANIVIVDEAALIEDDVIGAASPTLSRTNGKLWLLSTPNGQKGLFYHVWHDKALTDWFKVKATIEDSSYATPEFIAEQKSLFPLNFRQEFYCEFLPAKGSLLSRERIEQMIDPTIKHIPFQRLYKEPPH